VSRHRQVAAQGKEMMMRRTVQWERMFLVELEPLVAVD
jgi:hypothetical protein